MSGKRVIGILLTGSLLLTGSIASAKKKKPAADAGDFQPEDAPAGDQPSKVLERAFKLYDGEDFFSASIELSKVIEGESGDSEPNKQKAEFWMGKALYNLKFYSASLSYFDRIVQKGPSHAYYNATLKWLASLSRTLPDSTGILEKIGKYNRAELDQPALEKVRDELYFLLGKFYYQKGNFKEAVDLFQSVPSTSPFFDESIKPESVAEGLTVKATIYFYNCLYDRAEEAIGDFNAIYPQVFQELKKLITGTTDNAELFEVAVKIRKETSGLPEQVERAARGVLGDQSINRRFEYVGELDHELKLYDKADASWKSTNIAQNVFADLTLQRSLAVNEAGDLARRRIKRLTEELAQLIKRVIKIEYEILAGQKGELEEEVKQEQQVIQGHSNKHGTEIRADDEHELWPFNGEYWRDELGYYR